MQSTHHARRTLHRRHTADPFSRDPLLPDLAERAALERAGDGYAWVAIPVLVIATASILASPLFAVPRGLAVLVAGAELGLAALTVFLKVARNRTIADIAATTGREGYQRILRASAHYRWVGSVYGLAISVAAAILAVMLFRDAVSGGMDGTVTATLPPAGGVTPGDLLLLLVAFRLLQTVTAGLRYRWIRALPETRDYPELNRRFLIIRRRERLIRYVPVAGVVTSALFLWHGIPGIPLVVPVAGAVLTLLVMVLSLRPGMREKVPRKKASRGEVVRPVPPTPDTSDPIRGETLQKTPLPAPGGAADLRGPGTGIRESPISVVVAEQDPVFPDGGGYDPWW